MFDVISILKFGGISYIIYKIADALIASYTLMKTAKIITKHPVYNSSLPPVYSVIGAQFGDEGKGKLLDFIMKSADVCVRFNGGSNAGHTIVIDGKKYFTHVLPSGLLHHDKTCLMGNGMVIGLDNLKREMNELIREGFDIKRNLFVSDRAHVVLGIHKLIDSQNSARIGTTSQGIGPTYRDKAARIGLRIVDLIADNWESRIDAFYANYRDSPFSHILDEIIEKDKNTIRGELREFLIKNVVNSIDFFDKIKMEKKSIVFEGANATMIDLDHGTYPFVTSSSCISSGIFTGSGFDPTSFYNRPHEVIGVMKAYITRVGNGILMTEAADEYGETMRRVGGEVGVTTGRQRRCGWLDLPQMEYACKINGFTHLNITKLDVLASFDTVKICTQYRLKQSGEIVSTYPSDENELQHLEAEYVTFPGWKNFDFSEVRNYADLHRNIRDYIEFIEQFLFVPIKYINTGSDRNSMIIRNSPILRHSKKREIESGDTMPIISAGSNL